MIEMEKKVFCPEMVPGEESKREKTSHKEQV